MSLIPNLCAEAHYESISSTFYKQLYGQYSLPEKLQSQTVAREKLQKTLLYKKG
jgi:hypothetical protein